MSSGRGTGLFRVDASKPIVLVVAGRVIPSDVARLRDELGEELRGELTARAHGTHTAEVICDVGGLVQPSLAAVNVLAALQLDVRRQGCPLRLRGVGSELRLLLELVGLGFLAEREAGGAGEGNEGYDRNEGGGGDQGIPWGLRVLRGLRGARRDGRGARSGG
jgi:anti-anti-sigma regulatory factor